MGKNAENLSVNDDLDDLLPDKIISDEKDFINFDDGGSVLQIDTFERRKVVLEDKRTVRNCSAYLAAKYAPLVFFGGKFYCSFNGTWLNADSVIIQEANNICHQGGKNVIDSLAQSLRIFQESIHTRVFSSTDTDSSLLVKHIPEEMHISEILFSNGKYNVITDTFYPFETNGVEIDKDSEGVVFGPHITLNYNPEEPKSSFFEKYVKNVFPDDSYRRFFQRLMGTILAPHLHLRGYFVFFGEAKTGKSSLATALAYAPAGNNGYETKTEYALTYDKFESISLANKFVNISNDSVPSARWESWLKQYTSGRISVQAKFRDTESIIPTAKIISTCNSLNSTEDISGSYSTRFFPFYFRNKVKDDGASDNTKYLSENFWKQHREGIVYWLLDGYREFLEKGWKDIPESWEEDKKDLLRDNNPLEEWLENNLEAREESFISCDKIMLSIPPEFLKKTPLANRNLVYNTIKNIFGVTKKRSRSSGDRYGFQNICFKKENDSDE